MSSCKQCGGATNGYKCDLCGVESKEQESKHDCGKEHSMPKCQACGQAEAVCKC